jgi:hypothetical protein
VCISVMGGEQAAAILLTMRVEADKTKGPALGASVQAALRTTLGIFGMKTPGTRAGRITK